MKLRNFGYAAVLAVTAAAFVIGSAVPSDAKTKKKKAEAAPAPMASCFLAASKAVCATKGGMKFTYANSCYAARDGAKVVSGKACPAKAAAKPGKKGAKKAAKKPMKKT